MGIGAGMGGPAGGTFPQTPPAGPAPSQEEEVASLKDMAGALRQQLAEVMERIDRLEKEE
jgi:hypothetical protein